VKAIAGDARMGIDSDPTSMEECSSSRRYPRARQGSGSAEENRRWNADGIRVELKLIGDRPRPHRQKTAKIVQSRASDAPRVWAASAPGFGEARITISPCPLGVPVRHHPPTAATIRQCTRFKRILQADRRRESAKQRTDGKVRDEGISRAMMGVERTRLEARESEVSRM